MIEHNQQFNNYKKKTYEFQNKKQYKPIRTNPKGRSYKKHSKNFVKL